MQIMIYYVHSSDGHMKINNDSIIHGNNVVTAKMMIVESRVLILPKGRNGNFGGDLVPRPSRWNSRAWHLPLNETAGIIRVPGPA